MYPYRSPGLCARCGLTGVAGTWKLNKKTAQFSLWTFLETWFGVPVSRNLSNTFDVPICSGCQVTLEKIRKTTRGITITLAALFGLVFGIVWVKAFSGNLAAELAIMVLLTLIGALIGVFGGVISGLIIQDSFNYDFCSYDGEVFEFKNKKFRREFAALNPTLVKPKKN